MNSFKPVLKILLILLIGGIGVQTLISCTSKEIDFFTEDEIEQILSWDSSSGLCLGFEGEKREHYGMEKEQFCDDRDGKKYVYVTIDGKDWMAENLRFVHPESRCVSTLSGYGIFVYDSEECDVYGRHYTWDAAMFACPKGWHLPSDAEWGALLQHIAGCNPTADNCFYAGTPLKADSIWDKGPGYIAGTDDYGFSALPGGAGYNTVFDFVGIYGYWWSATHYQNVNAWFRCMDYNYNGVDRDNFEKDFLISVRCVRNY